MQIAAEPVIVGLSIGRLCAIVIPSALQALRGLTSAATIVTQAQNARNIENFQENDFQYFRYEALQNNQRIQNPLELYLNGKRIINEPTIMLNTLMRNQEILKIQRCAMSLWQYFPSGVVSFFSMLLTNKCARDEYLIIYTQNYVVSAEISRSKDCEACQFKNESLEPNFQPQECNCKKEKDFCFQIMIWDAKSFDEQSKIFKKYNKRNFSRVLKRFSVEKNNIAEKFSFSKLLCLWTLIMCIYQAQDKNSSIQKINQSIVRNSNTFARSSFYFLDTASNFKKSKIFESIFGLYCDKPGYLFDPIQSGVLCAVEKGLELKNEYYESKTKLENIIEELKSLNI
ncbi:hypothetical protein ABPG72_011598 [Tetrahymena utriculariae]